MRSTDKRYFRGGGLFAASNSSEGFKSYYKQVFEDRELSRIYIIKGGPGTGKSRFMKEVAEHAEALGRYVEYYYCSSDPDSLDGIIIEDTVAIIDGTAPHSVEPKTAGAREEIIDLGAFWDSDKLSARYSEIKLLGDKKSECYIKAYRYLSGCGELSGINRSLILPTLREEKMFAYVGRLLDTIPKGQGFSLTPALCDSVGMKGRVKFDTYEKCAEKLYYVIDWYSSAHFFLAALVCGAKSRDIPLKVSYDPINSERIDAVYFCNCGYAFVSVEPSEAEELDGKCVNMKRFVDKDTLENSKKEYRYNCRLYEALLSSACEAFSEAGEYHFELERIYSACMDFCAKERYTRSFCEMIDRMI